MQARPAALRSGSADPGPRPGTMQKAHFPCGVTRGNVSSNRAKMVKNRRQLAKSLAKGGGGSTTFRVEQEISGLVDAGTLEPQPSGAEKLGSLSKDPVNRSEAAQHSMCTILRDQ